MDGWMDKQTDVEAEYNHLLISLVWNDIIIFTQLIALNCSFSNIFWNVLQTSGWILSPNCFLSSNKSQQEFKEQIRFILLAFSTMFRNASEIGTGRLILYNIIFSYPNESWVTGGASQMTVNHLQRNFCTKLVHNLNAQIWYVKMYVCYTYH